MASVQEINAFLDVSAVWQGVIPQIVFRGGMLQKSTWIFVELADQKGLGFSYGSRGWWASDGG